MITTHIQDINNDYFTSNNVYAVLQFESLGGGLNMVKGVALDLRTSLKLLTLSGGFVRIAADLYLWRSLQIRKWAL